MKNFMKIDSIKNCPAPVLLLIVILLVLAIKFIFFSAETVVNSSELFCSNENEIVVCMDKKLKPFSGKAVAKNNNGFVRSITSYKNGLIDGVSKIYYDNGQLKEENTYRKGKAEGVSRGYYENGQLLGEIHNKNGELSGKIKMYYDDGSVLIDGMVEDGEMTYASCYSQEGEEIDCSEVRYLLATMWNNN